MGINGLLRFMKLAIHLFSYSFFSDFKTIKYNSNDGGF